MQDIQSKSIDTVPADFYEKIVEVDNDNGFNYSEVTIPPKQSKPKNELVDLKEAFKELNTDYAPVGRVNLSSIQNTASLLHKYYNKFMQELREYLGNEIGTNRIEAKSSNWFRIYTDEIQPELFNKLELLGCEWYINSAKKDKLKLCINLIWDWNGGEN